MSRLILGAEKRVEGRENLRRQLRYVRVYTDYSRGEERDGIFGSNYVDDKSDQASRSNGRQLSAKRMFPIALMRIYGAPALGEPRDQRQAGRGIFHRAGYGTALVPLFQTSDRE